jgi:hypothetical protein
MRNRLSPKCLLTTSIEKVQPCWRPPRRGGLLGQVWVIAKGRNDRVRDPIRIVILMGEQGRDLVQAFSRNVIKRKRAWLCR